MGTHPIFESDFDCLTEARQTKTSRIKSKLSNWAERQAERSSTRSRTQSFQKSQSMVDINSRLLKQTERKNSQFKLNNRVSNQSITKTKGAKNYNTPIDERLSKILST